MCYISSFTGTMSSICLNKMTIRDNVRATVRICIDKSLVYRLTLPPPSRGGVSPKFLPKQTLTFEIILLATSYKPVVIRVAS